jgi:hypothetical protein
MNTDVIAWLVPTTRHSSADKATCLPLNTAHTVSTSDIPQLQSLNSNTYSSPTRAIQLTFSQETLISGRFTLGTDLDTCDVLLPPLPNISAEHCCIEFDAESRLVLHDFSRSGTQVWYDWECAGDKTDYTWLLSGEPGDVFPSSAARIVLDIQGVRFQLLVNDRSADWEVYRGQVDDFTASTDATETDADVEGQGDGDVDLEVWFAEPCIQHVFVKGVGGEHTGEVYLWDTSRPWEPMVRASA